MNHEHHAKIREILELISRMNELGVAIKTKLHLLGEEIQPATKQDLHETEERIMSALSDFATKQNQFNDRIDTAVAGLQGDVKSLNDTITKLQGTPGAITPEDQALLDQLQTRASGIADKLDALDALTPPTPPTA